MQKILHDYDDMNIDELRELVASLSKDSKKKLKITIPITDYDMEEFRGLRNNEKIEWSFQTHGKDKRMVDVIIKRITSYL